LNQGTTMLFLENFLHNKEDTMIFRKPTIDEDVKKYRYSMKNNIATLPTGKNILRFTI
jgi:hypothetical protein